MNTIKPKISIYFLAIFSFLLYSCTNAIEDAELDGNVSENKVSSKRLTASSSDGHHYVGNIKNVLGDVKQGQINNLLKSTSEIDNLLDGFEEMGVNGIRIAIFANGVNPNETMYNYLYNEAVSRGFKIFANPAQGGGGARIANGILNGTLTSVKGDVAAQNRLINRIVEFAQDYKCDWINPFNEDGRPGSVWNASQFNAIYAGVSGRLNGADLIGSCDWGIQAGLLSLRQTNIKNFISVASTHNLGFQHGLWDDYIAEAGNLPVWDSEVNDFDKFGTGTRLDAAIAAGVDGLVLYDSWRRINKTTGELSNAEVAMKEKYTQYYFIKNKQSGDFIKPYRNGVQGTLMVQAPTSYSGDFTQWEIVPTSNGYVRFKNKGSGMYFRPANNNNYSNVYAINSFSGLALHVQWRIDDINNTSESFIVNRSSGKKLRSRNGNDLSNNSNETATRINQAPATWTGDAVRWEFIKAN